ncbi:CehA/McbA family metallohydrolase [Epibacterium sp. Ofav1-8]|uniref:CehA/McbA family metallohydrolase n=1 Tax=Epibacterium sp. Ofav1-8 TaxID=2917735 RepID=UPI001EF3E7FE|nr:CehA/McbA family metallohydrolase [Epibacterium sp. Ofav1-8]MCG7624681.1 CehA/McbA family metallohydrolase [Epibacterium sp. Ofav1-8]
MQLPPFDTPGRFFRGNLHTHSDMTDGALPPQEVCRRYKAEGYDFIALTDHFVGRWNYPITDTTPYRDENFTTLLGAELHSGAQENGALWHLLAVGLPADFEPSHSPDFQPVPGQETGPEIAERARKAGAFVALAHPQWSGLTMADARSITAAHAVEVYNHESHSFADRGTGMPTLDLLLSEGRRLTLIATDDAHFKAPDAFGGWVMVKARENTPEALLDALKAGLFYSSQGPEIHGIWYEDDRVRVKCSAATTVIVQAPGNASTMVTGSSLTEATIALGQLAQSPWLRVTVIDRAGKRAWSNPFWPADLAE